MNESPAPRRRLRKPLHTSREAWLLFTSILLCLDFELLNVGLVPGFKPWDPTFVILATAASVEAIFLSTFVLISQNRAAALDDKRADLDLQINLLSEHEVTRLLTLTKAIAKHLGVDTSDQPELEELERDVAPEAVLDKIEDRTMRSDQ